MAQVFISFIHEEGYVAEAVEKFIRGVFCNEVAAFLSSDTGTVYAGERWMDRIVDELREAKVVISLLSEESVKRPWVNFEAGAAWIKDSVLIPVCYGNMKKENLPKPYSSLQGVDITFPADQYYLVYSIARYLGMATPPEPFEKGNERFAAPYAELKDSLNFWGVD
ncbi:MAG TPA: toll/interleukin-1 receptor domain-containing protein [Terriglobia bacterium]|nr:toll/interleukin-1 receptor domain-containing protein [Terriglobia bacterium]